MTPVAFDGRWCPRGALVDAAARLHREAVRLEWIFGQRTRQRRAREAQAFADHCAQLVCNLAAVELAAPGRALATPRAGVAVLLDSLSAGGLLAHRVGGWDGERRRYVVSESRATLALLDYLPETLAPRHLGRAAGALIELRTRKNSRGRAETLPVPDTSETRRLVAQVHAINASLSVADVSRTDGLCLWLHETPDRLPRVVSTDAHHLRRVFNNGTLAHGGRLVGGWWQAMSQQARARAIRMDGERIVELDFVCTVPRICYALRGVPWPFGNDRDAAYIAGPQATRATWKLWTNALLFAEALLPSWVGKTAAERAAFAARFGGLGSAMARALVLAHHAPLAAAGGFGCGLGMEAMRAESDIAADVVLRLKARGITCLPVHDAFCVPASKADEARRAMTAAALARIGTTLGVAAK